MNPRRSALSLPSPLTSAVFRGRSESAAWLASDATPVACSTAGAATPVLTCRVDVGAAVNDDEPARLCRVPKRMSGRGRDAGQQFTRPWRPRVDEQACRGTEHDHLIGEHDRIRVSRSRRLPAAPPGRSAGAAESPRALRSQRPGRVEVVHGPGHVDRRPRPRTWHRLNLAMMNRPSVRGRIRPPAPRRRRGTGAPSA